MGRLKILADGKSPQARANERGKLFERLMADVLRHYGYSIDQISNVNYAGMEIDIEGEHITMDIPLYAECKCYETDVAAPKLQEFYGKYMTRWLKNKKCHGLFIALPGVNSHAKGFYKENIENNQETSVRLYEEEDVIKAIVGTSEVASPDALSKLITQEVGTPGEWLLLYTDKGLFWIQYIIPPGSGIPCNVAFFDAKATPISDKTTLDYLTQLYPELDDFQKISLSGAIALRTPSSSQVMEEIVEVRGSLSCFEYQFPASPEHFVGRHTVLGELDSFVKKVISKETSAHGILFEANSGWGKSSVVLASVARLKEMGHFAIAIDSRTAASSQFILRVLDYALSKFGDFSGLLSEDNKPTTITGFEGAPKSLISLGQVLGNNDKVMFIFLDQFENVFSMPDTLKRIRDLLFKLCDAQTNVVIGFSWKTDLIGLTSEFPYQIRDAITGLSKRITLDTFSEVETTALLNKLSEELGTPLRKDLKFFLSEFSQGYPWLLKKLCAHVKSQREAGVPQLDIANSLLNVEELFKEDLRGLGPVEEGALRHIAKAAPISVSEMGEELRPEVVQSLVNRRLIIKIGYKFDIYWDIFRDYLNTGKVPVQENYILRVQAGGVLKTTKLLTEAKGALNTSKFQKSAGLSKKSFYNILRDIRLLGIADIDDSKVTLLFSLPVEEKAFADSLRAYLREKLPRNRCVWRLLEELERTGSLTLDGLSGILAKSCPYISATKQTWQTYARIFADWMDFADLALFNKRDKTITLYRPGTEVRERHLLLARRRGGMTIPLIQYNPVEKLAIRLVQAIQEGGRMDWSGFARSTITKSLATLEDLGFIVRKPGSISILPKVKEFVSMPERRPALFAEGALKIKAFAIFIEILQSHQEKSSTLSQLASEIRSRLGVDWKEGTAIGLAKIMLNWARHAKLAPGVFAKSQRGRRKYEMKTGPQSSFFLDLDSN
ncbi:MAG: restriction endonuclease [candidate division Zixibacteria bacterium]|nr:restriction endonuclease [candidate division Zixibacteria bacterium]